MTRYKDTYLMKGSRALEMYLQWKKTGDKKDQAKLDKHLRELDKRFKELHYD